MSNVKPFVFLSFDEKEEEIKVEEKNAEENQQSQNLEEEIQKLYEEKLKEGFERGYNEGFEKGRTEGFEKGYEEGREKALLEEEKRLSEKINELNRQLEILKKVSEELSNFKERQLELLLPQILKLSFKIAEKILATKIILDREITLGILKEALNEVPLSEESIIVKLNPQDLSVISARVNELGFDRRNLKFEQADNLKPGDVEIETETLHVVATIEKKLEEIQNAINSILSKQS